MSELERIRERGVLKVGTTGDYLPFSYPDHATGKYIGFDAELAQDLAKAMNVDIEFVETSWPSLMDDLQNGRFDLAVCGITITEERKENALMSDGYLENGKTILCRKEDAEKFSSLSAVNTPEVRVMVNPGGLNEKFARENLVNAQLMIHEKNREISSLIAEGEADIMITEVVEAAYYTGLDDRLASPLLDAPFTDGKLGILMPKGSEELLDYVNNFLQKEKSSGRIDKLAKQYFLLSAE